MTIISVSSTCIFLPYKKTRHNVNDIFLHFLIQGKLKRKIRMEIAKEFLVNYILLLRLILNEALSSIKSGRSVDVILMLDLVDHQSGLSADVNPELDLTNCQAVTTLGRN